jgi:subtilisin family serine protease
MKLYVKAGAVAATALLFSMPAVAVAAEKPRVPASVDGSYIVVFERSTVNPDDKTRRLERAKGFRSRHRYERAVKGFAARLTDRQVRELRADPDVAFVSPNREVHALGGVPIAAGEDVPSGVRRIDASIAATVHAASTANVAVIDSGIDLAHPDLDAVDGTNCVTPGTPAQDDNGHGTHVAGTIGARNNGAGVVGVAPGTRTYAVKVLAASGGGSYADIICGIDWATATRTDSDPVNDISVVNMSLGGVGDPVAPCATTTDPLHRAICVSTAAGITYVVAAGNDGWDFDYAAAPDTPAAYPEALTVTAMSDSDGRSGASGGAPACTTGESDDMYSSFSNFAATSTGAAHTIAGPGVCVRSTWPGGGHATISGTSMATPHIAAAVALCLGEAGQAGPCAGMTPAQIVAKMRSDAQSRSSAVSSYGFRGDPLRPYSGVYFGYLGWAPMPDTTAPAIFAVSPVDGATAVAASTAVSVTFDEPMNKASAQAAFSLTRAADGAAVAGSFSWSGNTLAFRPSAALAEATQYRARIGTGARDLAGNALGAERAWDFKTVTTITSPAAGTGIETGTYRTGTYSRLSADDNLYYEITSTATSTRTSSWYARFTGVGRDLRSLRVLYKGRNSATCSQTVSVWRWTTSSWVQLDARSVGNTEALVDRSATGTLADYVSTTGEIRVRVRCTSTSTSFYSSGDQMRVIWTRP